VRSRLYRGTLDKETGTDGTVYVRLHADQLRHQDEQTADQSQPNTELVGELRARVEDRREQIGYLQGVIATRDEELRTRAEELRRRDQDLERRDRIIAALTERIPQALEPPSEASEAAEAVEEQQGRGEPRPEAPGAQEAAQRPWWRRWFGG
jgi:chromosome segregation ATPase